MLPNMRKILVPLDGSRNSFRSLNYAIYLARQCQTTLVGLYIDSGHTSLLISRPHKSPDPKVVKTVKKFMEDAKTKSARNGIEFNYEIITGVDPAYDILKYAVKMKADLIIMGARGLGEFKKMFLGSTSNYVLHKSTIPVLIVK
ncbi:universal stress protein [Candidatus Nitrosotenuis sp. DW1]|uniref:universal stress protein n=1 Tax=Candidatus Nitrosotenuis sp. DW1 TaxID=2259672 RepID=UPI0015CE504B|nr:universal stress protein [Candidatus Nitrosotenuis sp. DW1]QLH09260.1 universal stress protein [Candidatus Nitrosotenuis sp. DW1]